MNKIFLLLTVIVLVYGDEAAYDLIIHKTDPDAKCLDGSPPALYLHEGGD